MHIWTIRTDDNTGDNLTLFTDDATADAAALAWCKAHWFNDTPCPDDWAEAHAQLGDCESFMWYHRHEIDDTDAINAVIASAQAQLADLLEQVTQMRGMFSDEDGRIQRAIDDAEAWPSKAD